MNLSEYPLNLRCGISIFPSQDRAIDSLLSELVEKMPARFILLVDASGQFISAKGERHNLDLVALGSLAAGDLAASQEIARLSGQYQHHQLVIREGCDFHTLICEVGKYFLLVLQVSTNVPLGWVRLLLKDYADKVSAVIMSPPESVDELLKDIKQAESETLAQDMLDDLWGEG